MKRAIIIGASSGIGREVAELMLEKGWKLGLGARRKEKLDELKAKYPQQVETEAIDVQKPNGTEGLLSLIEKVGGMDIYVHVAGVGKQNVSLESDVEEQTVSTNALGFTRFVDCSFNYFASHKGGHIVVVSSIAGTKGLGVAPSYSATKAFQNNYIQALDQLAHLRKLPIRFTDIRPGFVDTDLLGDSQHYPLLMKKEEVAKDIVRSIEKGRHVRIIDWRYRILVAFWRLLPNRLWPLLPIKTRQQKT
ncbi:MAG: SDR family NAD(P)-dependent oxidoreductase [Prevotella sp.]|nr:SDR family NAD(P)-dependent oxidoreductase [Prevotella sp.]